MRWSRTYIPTLREKQADAELISHQLLLRGGYIRKLAAGVYLYLPLMQRVIDKFSDIVREEMNAAGSLEITMSVLCPAEVWKQSGRYDTMGKEQMRLKDRHMHDMVLCGTHEETVTYLVAGEVRSYKQLPLNLYQIQVKFRDEIRPRFGLMRGREFIMKDAYTFDADESSFRKTYDGMVEAYFKIFRRAGLDVLKVESDTGAMGGKSAHEFMQLVETTAGEETIISCPACNYAANVEKATFGLQKIAETGESLASMQTVSTPGAMSIEQVTAFLKIGAERLVKTLVVVADGKPAAALIRGDRELNEVKLKNALGVVDLEMANPTQVEQATGAPTGFAGPVGLRIPLIVDPMVAAMKNMVVGANKADAHTLNVNIKRDFEATKIVDITKSQEGDLCPNCGGTMIARKGIEVGNTFMLGTKYSIPLGATFLDADGKEQPMLMGSYGIGITRTPQAALEKYHDDKGIIWPKHLAPYTVALIPLNIEKAAQREAADRIYEMLQKSGHDVLYDDRTERAGVKLNDADLIGLPLRVVIGDKSLAEGKVELKARSQQHVQLIAVHEVPTAVDRLLAEIP